MIVTRWIPLASLRLRRSVHILTRCCRVLLPGALIARNVRRLGLLTSLPDFDATEPFRTAVTAEL